MLAVLSQHTDFHIPSLVAEAKHQQNQTIF
jgi:hypothetical protein